MKKKRTEADLCAAFVDSLEDGWIVYPETCGWDLLLVLNQRRKLTKSERFARRHGTDHPLEPGTQVGVEAKLRGNVTVLRQALPDLEWCEVEAQAGPDFRAVLVPKASGDFHAVARSLGLVVIEMESSRFGYGSDTPGRLESVLRYRRCWPHDRRHTLPEVIPTVPAGVPSPVVMSRWKIAAIKLCMRLRDRGFVTRSDFNELGLHTSTWYHRWLEKGEKVGRTQQWVKVKGWKPWDQIHPEVVAQLEAKRAEATP